MPDEPQNPILEENLVPASPQEPIPDAPISPNTSEQVEVPPVAPESPTKAESAIPVNNDNSASSPENGRIEQTAQTENPSSNEAVSATSQPSTAQIPVNEPFAKQSLLVKARDAIQFRKRKKLEKIMGMFEKKVYGSTGSPQVTNDEVEKLLHVSDATATRYLSILEKEGKIKQDGRTGRNVSYSKI